MYNMIPKISEVLLITQGKKRPYKRQFVHLSDDQYYNEAITNNIIQWRNYQDCINVFNYLFNDQFISDVEYGESNQDGKITFNTSHFSSELIHDIEEEFNLFIENYEVDINVNKNTFKVSIWI